MAEGTDFPESNSALLAPPGSENVYDLPVHRSEAGVISCWRLTPEEIAEVARTGVVWLHVVGTTHPPLLVRGDRPFEPAPSSAPADEGT